MTANVISMVCIALYYCCIVFSSYIKLCVVYDTSIIVFSFIRLLLRKYVYRFRNRLEPGDNIIIIHGIYLSQFLLQSIIWVWWRDILSS